MGKGNGMNFIEMIGFIISLGALFILAAKKALDERRRRANPEEYEREERAQAERLKAFLKSIDGDMEEDEEEELQMPKIQHRPVVKQQKPPQKPVITPAMIASQNEARKLNVSIEKQRARARLDDHYKMPSAPATSTGIHLQRENDAYEIKAIKYTNRATSILSGLKSRKDMIILQEIIAPPLALRKKL